MKSEKYLKLMRQRMDQFKNFKGMPKVVHDTRAALKHPNVFEMRKNAKERKEVPSFTHFDTKLQYIEELRNKGVLNTDMILGRAHTHSKIYQKKKHLEFNGFVYNTSYNATPEEIEELGLR
ncbi:unnamed protein product [Moneuplotes crassus]|uniref:Uncharacterized protein n=1 Tax=Euplotes crassus TaxID=5936 RepID=A0AAD1XXS2_EUPCR|nr:unnamed protein product [Moneuplotes crassus]